MLIAFTVYSCEQIVVIKLQEDQPKIVIESFISNGRGPFNVKISRSQSYFNQKEFEGITKAVVKISNPQVIETLVDRGSGHYSTSRIRGTPGIKYTLDVEVEGKNYNSAVVIPPPVLIDTVYFAKGLLHNDSLAAFVEFKDPAGFENFYRIKIYRNRYYAINDYYLINDNFTDGERLLAPIYRCNFAPGDTVDLELYNLEKSTWRYFKAVSEIIDQGVNLQAPGNPPSNISGGALGNFSAWGKSSLRVIVPGKAHK